MSEKDAGGFSGKSSPRPSDIVHLNVYDLLVDGKPLKHLNDIALPLGFGAFHSGLGKLAFYCGLTVCRDFWHGNIFFTFRRHLLVSSEAVLRCCLS